MNKKSNRLVCIDLLFAAVLLVFDQFTKHLAVVKLKGNAAFPIIRGVLELDYLENRGSAFGMLQGQRTLLLTSGVLFLGVILFLLVRLPADRRYRILHIIASGIIAGGLGNMLDRIRLGYVVDFISFVLIDYPIFNVADSYVVVCTVLLFILILFVYKEEDIERILRWKSRGKKTEDK